MPDSRILKHLININSFFNHGDTLFHSVCVFSLQEMNDHVFLCYSLFLHWTIITKLATLSANCFSSICYNFWSSFCVAFLWFSYFPYALLVLNYPRLPSSPRYIAPSKSITKIKSETLLILKVSKASLTRILANLNI